MTIKRHPYTGKVLRAMPNDISSETQRYKDVITVECDIETDFDGKDKVYNYTHRVWFWNDAVVTYNGVNMRWLDYILLIDRTPLKEGMYFESSYHDKVISGEIKLYSPSSQGVMLEVDTNSK
jgi:hypothetical protein